MSTSLNVVNIAAVARACTRRLAMVARLLDMRTRDSDRVLGAGCWVLDGGCWVLGAGRAAAGAAALLRTSSRLTRGPSAFTSASGTSRSRASRRADGVAPLAASG